MIKTADDWPYSGKSLEECEDLLRKDAASGSYAMETIAYALESLRNSPEDMSQYFNVFIEEASAVLKKQIDNDPSSSFQTALVASGKMSLEEMAKDLARGQLVHVIGAYIGSEVIRKWNSALDLKIPPTFL